LYVI